MPRLIEISLPPAQADIWAAAVHDAISDVDAEIAPDGTPPDMIDYLVYNIDSGLTDFTAYTRLRAILNTWAGVEAVVGELQWPAHVQFCRMVEPGLSQGMAEYFTTHVLRYHWDVDRAIAESTAGVWEKRLPPLFSERTVGILGLGALGRVTAEMLRPLGFRLTGWSRTPRDVPGVEARHGRDGLARVLAASEILIVILPQTPETENVLNAETLAMMPRGARIINAGRGGLIDDDALLAAIGTGQIGHATLDVFRTEPLPAEHAFWRHPGITVTPHIAAETRHKTAAQSIAAQIARDIRGEPLLHVVDPAVGY